MKMDRRVAGTFVVCGLLAVVLLAGMLFCGTASLDAAQVWGVLTGEGTDEVARLIVTDVRLPMALTALVSGMALAVSGLLLQTTFDNPLAGPSILGISTGASLGVAVVMLAFGGWLGTGVGYYSGILTGAFVGAGAVMGVLLLFSMFVRGNVMLLIIGILIGYLASSAISLLNFFSTQQGVHSYVIWGMGNFGGLTWDRLAVYAVIAVLGIAIAMLFVKQLNALLLGRRYAESMGMNVKRTRNWLMAVAGVLASVVTAFCGPVGFLGLVMPHVARMATGTANHAVLLPATVAMGGIGALFCAWRRVGCGGGQIKPERARTPVISIPVIIYVIFKGRK